MTKHAMSTPTGASERPPTLSSRLESRLYYAERLAALFDDPSIVFVARISGGKDSAAMRLDLREQGVPDERVVNLFADTGWEAPETYEYLPVLEQVIGPIVRVGAPGGMLAVAESKAGFPWRAGRWCTEKLKIDPMRAYADGLAAKGVEPVAVVGQRADESDSRAEMPMIEDDWELWGGWVWRPIKHWTVREVIDIHHRHGLPLNPLYLAGHNRVGCFPCIMADKAEIKLIADRHPERIDIIRELEAAFSAERVRRNATGEGNFKHTGATFFQAKQAGRVLPIDDAVAWSRTRRGERNLPLFPDPPDGGCFRWGYCEAPEDGAP